MLKRRVEVWDDGAWAVVEMKDLIPGQIMRMFDKEGDHFCKWVLASGLLRIILFFEMVYGAL